MASNLTGAVMEDLREWLVCKFFNGFRLRRLFRFNSTECSFNCVITAKQIYNHIMLCFPTVMCLVMYIYRCSKRVKIGFSFALCLYILPVSSMVD